jgi:hypothetical protein
VVLEEDHVPVVEFYFGQGEDKLEVAERAMQHAQQLQGVEALRYLSELVWKERFED